ncbi:hypothetical protein HYQ19_gp055 [Arthrobacter phage DrYang]|uniref:Uncharacterized protein n=1 Tax=Arthrobacter phage DrYang TaxID=2686080 RepID=A0A6B9J9W2_9CAUD|nr:hypothetical protein HYQ19_gp055 [Arthrobacter phage DrYang]QGZ17154.1 hypothetical protein SEA_DRYANG_55 [Arthrobacter phage DrYang]
MKLTHRDHEFNTVELAELRSFTIETRNGARLTVTESADGSLYVQEGSHRSLRIVPVVANAVRLEIVDPFLEAAAPMTPIPDVQTLAKVAPGSTVYSIKNRKCWTWHGGTTSPLFATTNIGYEGETFTDLAKFWQSEAPLLLAAKPE